MLFVRGFVFSFITLFISISLFAQKDNYVDADGVIEYHNRIPLVGATLKLYNGNQLVETIKTGENGEYHFKLEYNKEYILEISKKDLITKKIKYNTTMPAKVRGGWWVGIPINLYEVCPGIDASVFSEPVAVVEFNERRKEYRVNPDHNDIMQSKIRSFEQVNDKCLEGEFIKLVRNADELYDQKKYEEAKELYQEANEKRPWEIYASERLNEIDNQIAKQEASSNVFDNVVASGDRFFESGNLVAAKNAYKRALVIKPSDTYSRNKISEIDKELAQDAANQQQQIASDNQFNSLVSQGNRAFQANNLQLAERFYTQALELKPNESYPKTQLSTIKTKLAQNQAKQKENEQKRLEYNKKIATADAYLSQHKYDEAKASYLAAQQILPQEAYPSQKIREIDDALRRDQLLAQRLAKEKEEKEFAALLTSADNAYNQGDYDEAKLAYEKVLEIKPFDNYTKQRLAKTDKLIAAQEKQKNENELAYNKAIGAGNLFFQQQKYDLAKNEYNKALSLKPNETLPKTQIIKINQALEADQQAKLAKQQQEVDYRLAISAGEKYKNQRNFEAAKTSYNNALTIKPNDPLALSKLKEIENEEQKQQQLAAQKEVDAQYQQAILSGNQLLAQEKFAEAKQQFLAASRLKPQESLPKEQLLTVERAEQEKTRALALEKTREEAYQKSINDAGQAFASKDYFNARSMYNQALRYKPNDALATSKINEINRELERQKQQQQALAEKDRKFNELVANADNLFELKSYAQAKSSYNQALTLKQDSYTKAQIQKIDQILELQEQERQALLEREKNFTQAISKADELYTKKDYYTAKEMYEAALAIKPNDNYSKTKIKNITAFIEKLEASKEKTQVKTVAVKPQKVNILPELKFKDDTELELYLVELRQKYPEGITHEVYNAEREVMDRYVIVRKDETKELRRIRYSWGGTEFWINDKPCTSMYFNSQTKQRAGEYYNKVDK